jgi:hypothetical protein
MKSDEIKKQIIEKDGIEAWKKIEARALRTVNVLKNEGYIDADFRTKLK